MQFPAIRIPGGRVLAGVALGVVVGVVAVGAVAAESPAPSTPAAATSGSAKPSGLAALRASLRPGAIRKLAGRDYRVEVNATGAAGTQNLLYVRGTLTAGTANVTVTLPDKSTQGFTVDATTVVRQQGHIIALGDLTSGDSVRVFGRRTADGTYAARLIRRVVTRTPTPGGNSPGASLSAP